MATLLWTDGPLNLILNFKTIPGINVHLMNVTVVLKLKVEKTVKDLWPGKIEKNPEYLCVFYLYIEVLENPQPVNILKATVCKFKVLCKNENCCVVVGYICKVGTCGNTHTLKGERKL